MPKIEFEKRAVAFIDVLGFKSIVEGASDNSQKLQVLEELVTTLETAVPRLDGTVSSSVAVELIPRHIAISDCIILSAPLTSKTLGNYCGLSILVMRVIQLTHILLARGYLIRGGVSIGDVWHSDSTIVGRAYQEAYLIETKTGAPRVELSNTAKEYWLQTKGAARSMCLMYREHFMVNGLHDYYIQDRKHGSVKSVYESYGDAIEQRVSNEKIDSVQYKWWWFGEFLKNELERNQFIAAT